LPDRRSAHRGRDAPLLPFPPITISILLLATSVPGTLMWLPTVFGFAYSICQHFVPKKWLVKSGPIGTYFWHSL
jgi:hypothetical protein